MTTRLQTLKMRGEKNHKSWKDKRDERLSGARRTILLSMSARIDCQPQEREDQDP